MKLIRRSTFNRIRARLGHLYGKDRAEQLSDRIYMLIGRYGVTPEKGITESEARRPGAGSKNPKS